MAARNYDVVMRELRGAVDALHSPNAPSCVEFQAKLGELISLASELLDDDAAAAAIQDPVDKHAAKYAAIVDAKRQVEAKSKAKVA